MKLPQALLKDLHFLDGFNEAAFIAAHQEGPVTSIRRHPIKGVGTDLKGDQVAWHPEGIYLSGRPVFTLDPAYHAGAYYVQEASSMFLAHIFKSLFTLNSGLRVLDLCAAPGGKSTLIASLLGREDLLISNEVIRSRATILEENVTRWGYTNNWVTANDPTSFSKLEGFFDVIVIDAPCSGSGLFRKDSKALTEWSEANVMLCKGRQQRIIADIWPALKKGGTLVYATCSFSPQEDEDILDWISDEYGVATLPLANKKEWGITETQSAKNKMYGYRFLPGKTKGEGFFAAALNKTADSGTLKPARFKPYNGSKIKQQAGYLLRDEDWQFLQSGPENYHAINPAHEQDWYALQKSLYFRKLGLPLGVPTAKDWIPAHETALSIDAADALPAINVSKEQALKFLKREEIGISAAGKGWHVIKFNNLGLGWVKTLENRVNNYLPKHWRIRMDIPDNEYIT